MKQFLLHLVALATAVLLNAMESIAGTGKQHFVGLRPGFKVEPNLAMSTQGFKLEVSLLGVTYTEITQITDIPDPSGTSSDLDATNLQSVQKEYINGLRDSSAINITGQRVATDAGQNILRDNAGAAGALFFKNTYSDGSILMYKATCKKFGVTGGVDAVEMFTASIRATGDQDWSGTGAPTT
jgi:hypothetical protein